MNYHDKNTKYFFVSCKKEGGDEPKFVTPFSIVINDFNF